MRKTINPTGLILPNSQDVSDAPLIHFLIYAFLKYNVPSISISHQGPLKSRSSERPLYDIRRIMHHFGLMGAGGGKLVALIENPGLH